MIKLGRVSHLTMGVPKEGYVEDLLLCNQGDRFIQAATGCPI